MSKTTQYATAPVLKRYNSVSDMISDPELSQGEIVETILLDMLLLPNISKLKITGISRPRR
jgi:hypothetical protein